jgi:hypothetical protein
MNDDFAARVSSVDWSQYTHPCGQPQRLIPGLLLEIAYGFGDSRYQAALKLWDIAAHQGCVGPSALPTSKLIIEMLPTLPREIQVEVLDTLYQFAGSLLERWWSQWSGELLEAMGTALPELKELISDPDDDLSGLAQGIVKRVEAAQARFHATNHPAQPQVGD